LQDKGEMKK